MIEAKLERPYHDLSDTLEFYRAQYPYFGIEARKQRVHQIAEEVAYVYKVLLNFKGHSERNEKVVFLGKPEIFPCEQEVNLFGKLLKNKICQELHGEWPYGYDSVMQLELVTDLAPQGHLRNLLEQSKISAENYHPQFFEYFPKKSCTRITLTPQTITVKIDTEEKNIPPFSDFPKTLGNYKKMVPCPYIDCYLIAEVAIRIANLTSAILTAEGYAEKNENLLFEKVTLEFPAKENVECFKELLRKEIYCKLLGRSFRNSKKTKRVFNLMTAFGAFDSSSETEKFKWYFWQEGFLKDLLRQSGISSANSFFPKKYSIVIEVDPDLEILSIDMGKRA